MRRSFLRISAFHDEGQAYSLMVEASSGSFSGYTESILNPQGLKSVCLEMSAFPKNGLKSNFTWILKPWTGDHPDSKIDFFISDSRGGAAAHALLFSKQGDLLQSAHFHVPLEIAGINTLGRDLLRLLEYPLQQDVIEIETKG